MGSQTQKIQALLLCTDTLSKPPMTQHTSTSPNDCPEALWITCQTDLDGWLQQVPDGDAVGMDTEFTRRNTFYSQLSLLQLGHRGRYALVDPLAFDLGGTLEKHLGQRPLVCIMHSAGEDIETLAPWLPHGPATLFDTQLAAAFAGHDLGLGYRALVAEFCGEELDKGETRSDWNRRPLSDSQKRYATLDVVYLEALHEVLAAKLQQQNHAAWFAADCERLRERAHTDALPDQPQCDLHAAADWPVEQQAMLRRLLIWRERTARSIDAPRTWLIDNAQALDLTRHPPADMDQLMLATRGQRALRGPQRRELMELLQLPPAADEIDATASIPSRLHGEDKNTLRRMKQAVDDLASEHHLPPGLLCPRKALDAYLATRQWPASLEGWRREVLQPRLQNLLPDTAAT